MLAISGHPVHHKMSKPFRDLFFDLGQVLTKHKSTIHPEIKRVVEGVVGALDGGKKIFRRAAGHGFVGPHSHAINNVIQFIA